MSGETNHPPGDGGAPQLVDPVKQELLWPSIFNLIKVIAKQNALSDDVRSLIKNYLSAPEPLVVLTSVTVRNRVRPGPCLPVYLPACVGIAAHGLLLELQKRGGVPTVALTRVACLCPTSICRPHSCCTQCP